MNDVLAKFDRIAEGYAEHDYADPERYSARRAEVIVALGPRLESVAWLGAARACVVVGSARRLSGDSHCGAATVPAAMRPPAPSRRSSAVAVATARIVRDPGRPTRAR